jgi:hypothetical protein
MSKYKAGDTVTIKLDESNACRLNKIEANARMHFAASFSEKDVVSHQSAPEPIIAYVTINEHGFGWLSDRVDIYKRLAPGEQKFKLTYCPTTKKVTAEVVND